MKYFFTIALIFSISHHLSSSVSKEEYISGVVTGKFDEVWVTIKLDNKTKVKVKRAVLVKNEIAIKQGERFHLLEISNRSDLDYTPDAPTKN